jgi:hypothetical protein
LRKHWEWKNNDYLGVEGEMIFTNGKGSLFSKMNKRGNLAEEGIYVFKRELVGK